MLWASAGQRLAERELRQGVALGAGHVGCWRETVCVGARVQGVYLQSRVCPLRVLPTPREFRSAGRRRDRAETERVRV